MHYCCGGNRHHGFTRTHFSVDDRCGLGFVDQKARYSLDCILLRRKRLAKQLFHQDGMPGIRHTIVDWRILLLNRAQ